MILYKTTLYAEFQRKLAISRQYQIIIVEDILDNNVTFTPCIFHLLNPNSKFTLRLGKAAIETNCFRGKKCFFQLQKIKLMFSIDKMMIVKLKFNYYQLARD